MFEIEHCHIFQSIHYLPSNDVSVLQPGVVAWTYKGLLSSLQNLAKKPMKSDSIFEAPGSKRDGGNIIEFIKNDYRS
jgi:hypothetical protein